MTSASAPAVVAESSIKIRPGGRNRILVHISSDHPQVKTLKRAADFAATYHQASTGRLIAYDFGFSQDKEKWVRTQLKKSQQLSTN